MSTQENIFIGRRYIPKQCGGWDSSLNTEYENLSVVQWQGKSYTSKGTVPKGIDIENIQYWISSADYNAQVAIYEKNVSDYHQFTIDQINSINTGNTTFQNNVNTSIDDFKTSVNSSNTTFKNDINDDIITFKTSVNADNTTFKNGINGDVETFKTSVNTSISNIPNQDYITNKAKVSDVNNALALKANQEDLNATNTQLALKANKDELTNSLTPKGSCLYASLPTTGNTIGWYYYCSDGDGTHGAGNYAWNGTAWYFSGTGDNGYNILSSYLKNTIEIPLGTISTGAYIDPFGTLTPFAAFSYTDYIEISDGTIKIVNASPAATDNRRLAFYDSNKNLINVVDYSTIVNNMLTVKSPSNAKLVTVP
jgi:hypothetical protein